MNNFIYKLVNYLKELELDYKVSIGLFDDGQSIAIIPAEGWEVITTYMNGMVDIRLPFEIKIKSKKQEEALGVLNDVMSHVGNIGQFLTNVDTEYMLLNVAIDQLPFFEKKEEGYHYYKSKVTIDLSITK